MSIAAIVLAAGRSSRMGSNKLCAMLDGKPLVRHVADAALGSQASPVLVVTGHEQTRVEAALQGLSVVFIHNPVFAEGLAGSLKAGIGAVGDGPDGAVILLGDMPRVSPSLIDRLIDAYREGGPWDVVVPVRQSRRGNPVLIGRSLFGDMGRLEGDHGARSLFSTKPVRVREVEVNDAGIFLDADTPEALERLRGR